MTDRIIVVDEGDMFYGTPEQFEDCFGGCGGDEDVMRSVMEGCTFVAFDGELIDWSSIALGGDKQAILDQIAEATEK